MKTFDVYSYGVVASSTLYSIAGAFPQPEGYAEINDIRHMTGGEAANSSIVLARLGARVKLDGNWLGDNDSGRRTRALLSDYEIDTTRLTLRQGYEGARETVFAAQGTRTIFGTYGRVLGDAAWNTPEKRDITEAKVICLDPFFSKPAARVAEVAAHEKIPVVTVDCTFDNPLLRHVSAVVVAESFIRENYQHREPECVFEDYLAATDGLVVFTFGAKAVWYAKPGQQVRRMQAYSVNPVDTTGAGDSFRAGIVFGFLKGWDEDRMVDFAAAVAAINCTRSPGVMNSPTYEEVADFLGKNQRF